MSAYSAGHNLLLFPALRDATQNGGLFGECRELLRSIISSISIGSLITIISSIIIIIINSNIYRNAL